MKKKLKTTLIKRFRNFDCIVLKIDEKVSK